jgi:hypothetical protein
VAVEEAEVVVAEEGFALYAAPIAVPADAFVYKKFKHATFGVLPAFAPAKASHGVLISTPLHLLM